MVEWLRRWVNLGVTPPLSDWEVVSSNPIASMSGIQLLSKEEISMFFPIRKCCVLILYRTRSACSQFVAVCYCCKINKV